MIRRERMAEPLSSEVLRKTVQVVENCKGDLGKAAAMLHVHRESVRRRLAAARGIVLKQGSLVMKKKDGLSRKEFMSQFDVATRVRESIRKAIKALGSDEIVKDSGFRTDHCGESNVAAWRQVVDEVEFLQYQFSFEGKTWWATAATVKWAVQNVTRARLLGG